MAKLQLDQNEKGNFQVDNFNPDVITIKMALGLKKLFPPTPDVISERW